MAVSNDVVKYFRRKSSEGFEPLTYFGAEQRYVTALSNSNTNNLEEQYLLGTDTYVQISFDEEENQIIEKFFKKDNSDKEYYKLVSIVYKIENQQNTDFYFEDDIFTICNRSEDISYDSSEKEFDFNNVNYVTFIIDEYGEGYMEVFPNNYTISQIDTLYYVNKNKESIYVARKVTDKKVTSDGKTIVRETIEN